MSNTMTERIPPPPGGNWIPPLFADITTQWPAHFGPDISVDAPSPILTLNWDESHHPTAGTGAAAARALQKNKHDDYDGYTNKPAGTPLMIPTSDSDYEHDDPNPKPGNSKGSAAGYSRMKALFEWVIHKATRLLLDLDAAKTAGNAGNYATARTNYLNLLAGLNGTGGNPGALGYSVIKWVYVNPTIRAGRIEGATLILQWNPHSSSSMIHK